MVLCGRIGRLAPPSDFDLESIWPARRWLSKIPGRVIPWVNSTEFCPGPMIYFSNMVVTMDTTTSNTAFVTQSILLRRAVDLSRRIYTSLPWGYRIAELFTVLAGDSLEAFGRVIYAEFIKSVVRGMPDVAPGRRPSISSGYRTKRRGRFAFRVRSSLRIEGFQSVAVKAWRA